jgi:integrase
MNRPRKNHLELKLPPCYYWRHGAFHYVKRGIWSKVGTTKQSVANHYRDLIDTPAGAMGPLIDDALEYIKPNISAATYKQYKGATKKLKKAFIEFSPEQVKQKHVMKFKVSYRRIPNMTNRCLSLLRQVFDYALEIEYPGIDTNPAVGIKRLRENKRERLITATEYAAIYGVSGPRLQVITDLCIRSGKRITKVLRIRRADLLEVGIRFPRDKGEKNDQIVKWTSELREVVERAKGLRGGNVAALTLLCNRRGKAPDYRTVKDQWDKACRKAGVEDATIHDLRAVAATKAESQGKNPTSLLNHSSEQQTKRYLRGRKVPEVEGPSFGHPIDSSKNGE